MNTTGRNLHARAILGAGLADRLPEIKVLLVGAGGIGCELLKNIVLAGFGKITLLDLDTIDLSNLNRQFLFRKKDVKQSKALVAAATAHAFNPNVQITPIHANIKEPQFDIDWFQGFDLVLNALDNLEARRHVNKMCMASGVPLVESGTAGYLGQVQPLIKDRTECFDCISKPAPKSFPVCTIRSTPSQPIHCIVWAKSYLLPQLFGEDEDAGTELDDAEKQGENAQEIATLRKEAQAFKAVRHALRSANTTEDAARMAFQKVFNSDILNLLSMADMWRSRAPPIPLDFDAIKATIPANGKPVSPTKTPKGKGRSKAKVTPAPSTRPNTRSRAKAPQAPVKVPIAEELVASTSTVPAAAAAAPSGLKDQRTLSLPDNLALFIDSTNRLAARLRAREDTISFDKDDDDTLDFVTAAANLRSSAYGIDGKTRWEIKEMAGNIIPAIATTNAIISGLIVLQAMHMLKKSYNAMRNVHIQYKPSVPLSTIDMSQPNPRCGVCRDTYAKVLCDPTKVTLGQFVEGVLGTGDGNGTGPREVSVYEDKRVLSDPDWTDNNERTLASLNVSRGMFVTIVDEDGDFGTIAVGLGVLPEAHPADGPSIIFPSPLPLPQKIQRPATPPPAPSLKRSAPDDDDVVIDEPAAKRVKTNGGGAVSPSKKKRLDEDGFITLDGGDDSGPIEID